MKKITSKLFKSLLGIVTLSSISVPLTACSNKEDSDEKILPTECLDIVANDLIGFKSGTDFSPYNSIAIPSNVRVIKTGAFKDVGDTITKITFSNSVRVFETNLFGATSNGVNKIDILDFSSYTESNIGFTEFKAAAFEGLSEGKIVFNNEISKETKQVFSTKLVDAGINPEWVVEKTTNNITCSAKELASQTGTEKFEFNLTSSLSDDGYITCTYKISSSTNNTQVYVVPQTITSGSTCYMSATMYNRAGLQVDDNVVFDATFSCYTSTTAKLPAWIEKISGLKLTSLKSEPKVNFTDLTPGKEFTPTIPPTETRYSRSDRQVVADAYFKHDQAQTILKEDVLGYLKGYVDLWEDFATLLPWLQEHFPTVYEWVLEKLSDYGLEDVRDITYCEIGLSDITIASTSPQDTLYPYKASLTIVLYAKANLVDSESNEETINGETELSLKLRLTDLPYNLNISLTTGNWYASLEELYLKSYTGWKIEPFISCKITRNEELVIEFINEQLKSWSAYPTTQEEKEEFNKLRLLLQFDSTYLGQPSD